MNRLQQKCVIASAGIHSLLLLILLVGPAFLTSKSKSDNSPILDVIPANLIDAAFSGGGNPNAKPPPPAPPAPPAPPVAQPAPAASRPRCGAGTPPGTRQRGQTDQTRPGCAGAEPRPQAEEAGGPHNTDNPQAGYRASPRSRQPRPQPPTPRRERSWPMRGGGRRT